MRKVTISVELEIDDSQCDQEEADDFPGFIADVMESYLYDNFNRAARDQIQYRPPGSDPGPFVLSAGRYSDHHQPNASRSSRLSLADKELIEEHHAIYAYYIKTSSEEKPDGEGLIKSLKNWEKRVAERLGVPCQEEEQA